MFCNVIFTKFRINHYQKHFPSAPRNIKKQSQKKQIVLQAGMENIINIHKVTASITTNASRVT